MKRTDQQRLVWLQTPSVSNVKDIVCHSGLTISNYIIKYRKEIDEMMDNIRPYTILPRK